MYSLDRFVLDLPLLPGHGIPESRVVACVDDSLTELPELAFTPNDQQRRVEIWVIFAEVLLALVTLHLGLLNCPIIELMFLDSGECLHILYNDRCLLYYQKVLSL